MWFLSTPTRKNQSKAYDKSKPVHNKGTGWEVSSGVEPLYEVLQTSA